MISHKLSVVIFFTLLLVLVVACSDESDPVQPIDTSVDDYIQSLPEWDEFSAPLADVDVAGEPVQSFEWDGDETDRYICSVTHHDLTSTPSDIVTFNMGADVLWLGGLIQGRTYIGGLGSMEELPIRQRAPLTIKLDRLSGTVTRTVEHPDAASVQTAIAELIESAELSGLQGSSSMFYEQSEFHGVNQMALNLGMSARYMGTNVRSKFGFMTSVEENSMSAVFKQELFTVSIIQPQTPSDLFSDEFTAGHLQDQVDLDRIGPDNPPVYVSQIVYGRIMMMTATSTSTSDSLSLAISATNRSLGMGGSVDASLLSVLENSELRIMTIGGSDESAEALLCSGELSDYFAAESQLTAAAPISYKLRNLPDNDLAKAAETIDYDVTECSATETIMYGDATEVAWQLSLEGDLGGVLHTWRPSSENLALAQELGWEPGNNVNVGDCLTLLGEDTGFPFDFCIEALEEGASFTHNDTEFDGGFPMLSPGDVDDFQQDDFMITILAVDPGYEVVGLGVDIGDNGSTFEEALMIYDREDHLIASFTEGLPHSSGYVFCGVLDSWPIGAYKYLEDDGGDDICLQSFFFGVRETP